MQDGSVSPVRNFFRNKWVRLILIIDIAVIIFIIVISVNKATQTSVLAFNIAPIDATITVNGKGGYKNLGQPLGKNQNSGQVYSFIPGTYEIEISHPDLDTKTFTVNLEPNSNTTITTFLSKDGDFHYYTLRDNYGSFVRLASIASANDNQTTDHDTSAENFIRTFQDAYQFAQLELPLDYYTYEKTTEPTILYTTTRDVTINFSNDSKCQKTLCLKAIIRVGNKEFVEKLLEEKGFDLKQYEVIYETSFSQG